MGRPAQSRRLMGLRGGPAPGQHGNGPADRRRRGGDHRRPVHRRQGAPRRLHGDRSRRPGRRDDLGPGAGRDPLAADRDPAGAGRRALAAAVADLPAAEIARVFRAEYGRAVAVLVRVFGDIDIAEDAVQDAFAAALVHWRSGGLPASPAGWIITTARNKATDKLRREALRPARQAEAARLHAAGTSAVAPGTVDLSLVDLSPGDASTGDPSTVDPSTVDPSTGEPQEEDSVPDDRLRLIFTCCHPALSSAAQVALTLRLLGGLTTAEIAHAFLVPEPTMAQRLVRAKGKIRDAA